MEFAHLPNSVSIASGERLSYLVYHSPGMGWWLDVYLNGPHDQSDWAEIRRIEPIDHALVRSADKAFEVALEYEELSRGGPIAGRMDEALLRAGCAVRMR